MIEENDKGHVDKGYVHMIGHVLIRDPDTNEIILQQRDKQILNKEKNDDTRNN